MKCDYNISVKYYNTIVKLAKPGRVLILLFLSLMLFICACKSRENRTKRVQTETDVSSIKDKFPPYLRLPMEGIIPTIDPAYTIETASIEITEQLFLGLTDFDPETYEVRPELAESWTVSFDGRVYRFNMRKDAYWTDGQPVTAHDIVWAIRRNLRFQTESPYAYSLFILKEARAINSGELRGGKLIDPSELGVKAIDDYTIEFTLEHRAAYFPAMVGLWIYRPLPGKTIEKCKEDWTRPENIRTNGSYMLSAWKKGKMMILKKNPKYYDADRVAIPEVHYYTVPESTSGFIMYKNDELDIIGGSYMRLPLDDLPLIKSNPVLSIEYSNQPEFSTYYIGFNTKRTPVNSLLVRKAIIAAINRKLLIDVVTKGDEEPAMTFTRPPLFGSVAPDKGIGIGFNPTQARKWLTEAGYPRGEGFPEITLMHNTSETHANIAKAIQTFLKYYLNINIKIVHKEWTEYAEAIEQPDTPHMFRLGWSADYPDANNWLHEVFHPEISMNFIGWDNQEFADYVDGAQKTTDSNTRKAFYEEAEKILCVKEAAIMPLFFYTAQYLVKPRVKDWYPMALGGQHIRNWSLD